MPITNRKAVNKNNLLNEGVQIMLAQGYHGTGVKELVDSVGIPKGSFYQYFKSKEHFGAESIAHYVAPYIERLKFHIRTHPSDALGALKDYFGEQIDDAVANDYQGGCLLGNLLGEIGDTDGLCRRALMSAVNDYCLEIKFALEKAQSEGTVSKQLDSEEMANLLFNTWQGALLRMKVDRSVQPLRACLSGLLDRSFRK